MGYDSGGSMRTVFRSVSLVVVLLLAAACRQADGPVPQPKGDEPNEVYELSRDILNVAGGDPQALREMSDDLGTQGPLETGQPGAGALAKSLQTALVSRRLSDEQARRLAGDLYIVFTADKLSVSQVDALQERVGGLLREVGAPESAIPPVRNDIKSVQALVNTSGRHWWEFR